jgi:hypothetical protein
VGGVHGAIQHKRGGDAIVPRPTYESCGFPVTVWDLINQPFALGSPTIKAGHLGGRCGFINEGQSFRIKGRLCFSQDLTCGGDVVSILFGRVDILFLNGSLRWRRKRKIAVWLTFVFSFAKRVLSSASVLFGCSATSFLTRSVCGASANVLWPPNLAGLTLPV